VLQKAWSGERFSHTGTRWHFEDIRVTPAPVQPGGPPLWLASSSGPGAARAVRFRTHLLPQGPRGTVLDAWREQLAAAGDDPDRYRVGIIRTFLVTDDPERDWPPLRDAERYRMQVYSRFAEEAGQGGRAAFEQADRIPQRVVVGDVEHCADELIRFITQFGLTDVVTWGSAPGLLPSALTPSMERFTTEVVPRVRAALEAGGAT
jgi:alkanesulfonate monooxygenase SsuD/methylene tetrahydromethanopterin reductase-like flavin-dependent oxidoreductase (luciferase family)